MISRSQKHSPIDVPDVVTQYTQKDFNVLQENFSAKYVTNLGISPQSAIRRINRHQACLSLENPKHNNFEQEALYTHHDADSNGSELSDIDESFCLQMKVQKTQSSHPQVPKPVYLMTNLVYHLQLHHKQNQYLHARLDTCADVNLMPMAVYQLMFKDPSLRKLTPSTMEIETYMNDVVKIIGTCQFYLVHPESKELIKVIFFVTKENGSVLLSCRTTMALGLIKP